MCSPSNSFGNLFRRTPTVLHDMGPFDRKPACLVCCLGGRLERSAEEALSPIRQQRKRHEKQKVVHKTDLRFHITQRAPPREDGEELKRANWD